MTKQRVVTQVGGDLHLWVGDEETIKSTRGMGMWVVWQKILKEPTPTYLNLKEKLAGTFTGLCND